MILTSPGFKPTKNKLDKHIRLLHIRINLKAGEVTYLTTLNQTMSVVLKEGGRRVGAEGWVSN